MGMLTDLITEAQQRQEAKRAAAEAEAIKQQSAAHAEEHDALLRAYRSTFSPLLRSCLHAQTDDTIFPQQWVLVFSHASQSFQLRYIAPSDTWALWMNGAHGYSIHHMTTDTADDDLLLTIAKLMKGNA